jgi:alpha-beta hydrolase superfamily lysophospholipase
MDGVAAHDSGTLPGVGGIDLFWQCWRAATPRATVVLAHGASEHSGRYEHVARAFNERGYSVWALDHRGHGRSSGDRVYIEHFEYLVDDLQGLIDLAREELPGRKPYLLGHSMGGAVATGYAIRRGSQLAGLILSNPVATVKTAPAAAAVSRVLSRLTPKLGVYAVPAEGVSKDPEEVRKYVEDPLNFHGKLPARTVAELGAEVDSFPDGAARITIPTLIMYSRSDPIVAPEGSEMLAERLGSDDVTLRNWDGLRHEILNEPERDQVIGEMLDWLDERSTDE